MPNFDSASRTKIQSVRTASRLIQVIFSVYTQAKDAQSLLTLYTSGTDSSFNAAVNAMLTTGERNEIGAMLTDLNNLITVWERDHPNVITSG
jgi:hypothetical protein